jgi:hypothetical protein
VLYHRESRRALIACGVVDDEGKARGLVELAAMIAGSFAGVGMVFPPGGVPQVMHKTEDGNQWRSARESPPAPPATA